MVIYQEGEKNPQNYASAHPGPLHQEKKKTALLKENLGIEGTEEDSSF